jgi:hypothetical protein
MRTDLTNPTWVLALGVQQRTHESQEPSLFWLTDCTVQRTNEIDSFFSHETEWSKHQPRVYLKACFITVRPIPEWHTKLLTLQKGNYAISRELNNPTMFLQNNTKKFKMLLTQ